MGAFCRRSHVVLAYVGALVALLGIVGFVTLEQVFRSLLQRRLPLLPGSESFNGWKKIPFPIYQRFYYFNVTNADEFLHFGAKPVLKEVGPYTWRSEWVKEAVEWNSNGTVQYRERKRFWFDREHSVGDQEDMIVTINTPLVGASQRVRRASPLIRLAVAVFLNAANETVFITRSVRQLTFEGYPDILSQISHMLDPTVPVKNGRFAYMSKKNDSDEGLFNVFSGIDGDLSRFNSIDRWNGRTELPWWEPGSPCARLLGTNGELVHPIQSSDSHIHFFTPSFCKPWKLTRTFEAVDSFGLSLARFVADSQVLYNSSRAPEHRCFETPGNSIASGGMDLSRCQFGLPLVLSYPHFYAADPVYLEMVEGLKPDPRRHQFHIDIEPRLGIALGLAARAQINVKLQRVQFLRYFRDIPELVLPIFWQEVVIEQTPSFADFVHRTLDRPLLYARMAYAFMTICGFIVSAAVIVHLIILYRRQSQMDSQNHWMPGKTPAALPWNNGEKVIAKAAGLFSPVATKAFKEPADVKGAKLKKSSVPSAPALNNCKSAAVEDSKAAAEAVQDERDASKKIEGTWLRNVLCQDDDGEREISKKMCNVIPPK